jgi:beta-glucanase (GH16 family)
MGYASSTPVDQANQFTSKTYVDTQDALKVSKAGDTMTGALTLSGAPTSNLHAATKAYVDSAISGAGTGDFKKDGTVAMTGNLNMGTTNKIINLAAPTLTTDATTKTYVDTANALKVSKSGDTMTGALTLPGAPT